MEKTGADGNADNGNAIMSIIDDIPNPPLVDALLLSCIDFRMVEPTARYMHRRGMAGKYNHMAIAGGCLAPALQPESHWAQLIRDHINIGRRLHGIPKIIVMNHRDCGAGRLLLHEDLALDPARETEIHATYLRRMGRFIRDYCPPLQVELLLMSLDGSVREITPTGGQEG